ncbi:MAG TPA: hypothetical protein VK502_02125 [Candidatus Saccharimonadales bacterium]|nr:hypothetical protein [Candidatus Saccharimonadales bacterium]
MSQPKLDIVLTFGPPYEDTGFGLRLYAIVYFCGKVLDEAQLQAVRAVFEKLPSCNDFTPDAKGKSLMMGTNTDRSTWPAFEQEVMNAADQNFNVTRHVYQDGRSAR